MNFYKNNQGYALLLTLLLIVLTISISTVIASASINHSKQEVRVDKKNQSVVAAEMGVKVNLNIIINKLNLLNDEYKEKMKSELNELEEKATMVTQAKYKNLEFPQNMASSRCQYHYTAQQVNAWIDCETQEIENTGLNFYIERINLIYDQMNYSEQVVYGDTKYKLQSMKESLLMEPSSRIIELPFVIIGENNGIPSSLNATILATVPDHTSETNEVVIKTILSESETINRIFIPPNDSARICPVNPEDMLSGVCKYTGTGLETYLSKLPDPSKVSIKIEDLCYAVEDKQKCNLNNLDGNNGTVYIKPSNQTLNVDNLNNLQDISMYVDGELIIKNSNSAENNTLVSRAYSFHVSMNLINSNIVVLGDENKTGYIDWKSTGKSVTVSTNSKMCINLNGIDLSASSDLDTSILSGNGQLIFYPSRINEDKLPAEQVGKVRYINDFVEFLNQCNVNTAGLPEGHSMKQYIESETKIEELVEYQ